MILDTYLLYSFLKRLTTPFEKWDAFKHGIIDEKGNVLRRRASLKDSERKAWGYFDVMTCNLKKLLTTIPGGSTKIASFAAALILLREQNVEDISHEMLCEEIRLLNLLINEDAPVNNVGSGMIAGVTKDLDSMKFDRRKHRILRRRRRRSLRRNLS